MCVLVLGTQELPEAKKRLDKKLNGQETESYIG